MIKYIDEKTHELRYVLKNRRTGDVYFVVLFTLDHVPSIDENSPNGSRPSTGNGEVEESRSQFGHVPAPCADDVD